MNISSGKRGRNVLIGTALCVAAALGVAFAIARTGSTASSSPAVQPQSLWPLYSEVLVHAKYIDLTHAFAPGQPRGTSLGELQVAAARATEAIPGLVTAGAPIGYDPQGVAITAYVLGSDQIGTQLDPPAHWSAFGATISDIPPTVALRPLVVINVANKVAADPAYVADLADVRGWEKTHGTIPPGAVVMFRSDWSQRWSDPKRFTASPHPGVGLDALKYLHLERHILLHGHETLDTDDTPNFVAEAWLLRHNFMQIESVTNLNQVPEAGSLIAIGFAKPEGGTGGLARLIAIAPAGWPHGTTIAQAPGAPLPEQPAALERGADGVLRPTGPRRR